MTKKEYCLSNEPIAYHDYYRMQIHGIEYGIDDYAYVSRLYQPTYCGETKVMFHKVKINYDVDGIAYIIINERKFDGKRHKLYLNLDNFIRVNSPWGMAGISCAELSAII